MPIRYFDFGGRLAHVTVDENDVPMHCEVYEPDEGRFVQRDDLTLDMIDGHHAHLTGKAEYSALLARVSVSRS